MKFIKYFTILLPFLFFILSCGLDIEDVENVGWYEVDYYFNKKFAKEYNSEIINKINSLLEKYGYFKKYYEWGNQGYVSSTDYGVVSKTGVLFLIYPNQSGIIKTETAILSSKDIENFKDPERFKGKTQFNWDISTERLIFDISNITDPEVKRFTKDSKSIEPYLKEILKEHIDENDYKEFTQFYGNLINQYQEDNDMLVLNDIGFVRDNFNLEDTYWIPKKRILINKQHMYDRYNKFGDYAITRISDTRKWLLDETIEKVISLLKYIEENDNNGLIRIILNSPGGAKDLKFSDQNPIYDEGTFIFLGVSKDYPEDNIVRSKGKFKKQADYLKYYVNEGDFDSAILKFLKNIKSIVDNDEKYLMLSKAEKSYAKKNYRTAINQYESYLKYLLKSGYKETDPEYLLALIELSRAYSQARSDKYHYKKAMNIANKVKKISPKFKEKAENLIKWIDRNHWEY